MATFKKKYLGDGAYVQFNGHGLWITAEDGASVLQRVYLDPIAYRGLVDYVDRLRPEPEPDEPARPGFGSLGEVVADA